MHSTLIYSYTFILNQKKMNMNIFRERVGGLAAFALASVGRAGRAAPTVNLTLYRITPRNYTGEELRHWVGRRRCISSASTAVSRRVRRKIGSNLLCQNEPILQIPGFNVYTRTIVEADARFGDYSECNPDPDTGVFACGHFHFHHRACWFNDTENPQWKQEFADFCDPNVCSCDAVEKESVGHEALGDVFGRFSVKDWPQQCLDDFYAVEDYVFGKPTHTLDGGREARATPVPTPRTIISGCGGYTYHI